MALPAHLYRLWGETATHKFPKMQLKMFGFVFHCFPTCPPAGEDHARVLTEALWWEKNADIHSHTVSFYLHFHKDLGNITSQS